MVTSDTGSEAVPTSNWPVVATSIRSAERYVFDWIRSVPSIRIVPQECDPVIEISSFEDTEHEKEMTPRQKNDKDRETTSCKDDMMGIKEEQLKDRNSVLRWTCYNECLATWNKEFMSSRMNCYCVGIWLFINHLRVQLSLQATVVRSASMRHVNDLPRRAKMLKRRDVCVLPLSLTS